MQSLTTIPVSRATRDKLKRLGSKGETYDTILQRLLEDAEDRLFYERQKRILEASEFVPLDQV